MLIFSFQDFFFKFKSKYRLLHHNICGVQKKKNFNNINYRTAKLLRLNSSRGLRDASLTIYDCIWCHLVAIADHSNWNIRRGFSGYWGVGWHFQYACSEFRNHALFITIVQSKEIGHEESGIISTPAIIKS